MHSWQDLTKINKSISCKIYKLYLIIIHTLTQEKCILTARQEENVEIKYNEEIYKLIVTQFRRILKKKKINFTHDLK